MSSRIRILALVTIGGLGVLAYQPTFFLGTRLNGVAIGTIVALGSAPMITGLLDWALRRRFPRCSVADRDPGGNRRRHACSAA